MKVFVYGNTLNSAFNLAKEMRSQGVDAEVFLDNTSSSQQDFPWWDYPEYSPQNLPDWVHYYDTFPFFLLPNAQTRAMIDNFSRCDIALVSGWGPILAMKAKVPFVFHSLGSDLHSIDAIVGLKSIFKSQTTLGDKFRKFVKILTYAPLQKKALKTHAKKIIISMGFQNNSYIKKFGLQDKTYLWNYPKDIKNYGVQLDEQLYEAYKRYDVVFFMLSRHSWHSVWNDLKGNDKFIRAFSRFVKEFSPNVKFITSNKGIDINASKALIKELGIEQYVEWMEDMPKYQLKKFQALPNIVMVDNFGHDKWFERFPKDSIPRVGFGFGSIESLASKSLLLTAFTDDDFYGNTKPPILYAFTQDEIYERLVQVLNMSISEKKQMQQDGFDFAMQWHEQTNILHKHIDLLRKISHNKTE